MNSIELEKEIRRNCISCFILRRTLEDYRQIYEMKREEIEQEDNKILIEELAKIIAIPGKLEEKYAVLKRLSKSEPDDSCELLKQQSKDFDKTQEDKCLVNLQKIISAIKCFYKGDTDTICDKALYKGEILSLMHEENKGKKDIFGEQYDKEKGENALKKYNAKRKSEDSTEEIAEGLEYIFKFYCYASIDFCDMYNREKCFFRIANIIKDENDVKKEFHDNVTDYFNRVSILPEDRKKILLDFLNRMPKNFGYNLKVVMHYKNMTENDIISLFPNNKYNISKIQELQKNKTRPKEKESENFLLYLCRALLVSEDVLCLGHGKSYGNWMSVLSKEGLNGLQKAIEKDGEFQEIDSSKRNKIKEFARNEIIQIINDDYEEVIKNNPGFFEEEDFEVYESKEELFINIIDKEYAYILLEVLERMN